MTETIQRREQIGAGNRATVAGMLGSPAPLAQTVMVGAPAGERHGHRLKPRLYDPLIGDPTDSPMLPQAAGSVTTTRTALPPTRERAPRRALY